MEAKLHRQSARSAWISNPFAGGKLPITPSREQHQLRQFDPSHPAEMSEALDLTVPLVVDIKSGNNWLDAK